MSQTRKHEEEEHAAKSHIARWLATKRRAHRQPSAEDVTP